MPKGVKVFYVTGRRCRRGHQSKRYLSNGKCVFCFREQNRKRMGAHRKTNEFLSKEAREKRRSTKRRISGLPAPTRPDPGKCECCGALPGYHSMALDHDHTSKAFRGWLCGNCNMGIGKLGDNVDGLLKALYYLSVTAKNGENIESYTN